MAEDDDETPPAAAEEPEEQQQPQQDDDVVVDDDDDDDDIVEAADDATAVAQEAERKRLALLEAKAVEEATASADESYVPSPSLLNASTADPLLKQVDGPSLKQYEGKESVYSGRSVPIHIRAKLDVPIHVTAPGSVVEYAVETKTYDISFGITAEREEGITIVRENARVDSHEAPVTGKFLVGAVPCMLAFTFDNGYSWVREKSVSYRITVTPPSPELIQAGRRRRAKACHKAVSEDLKSARTRYESVSTQKVALQQEMERLEKELQEKKGQLEAAKTEEQWLQTRVALREEQFKLLNSRLENGWEDEA